MIKTKNIHLFKVSQTIAIAFNSVIFALLAIFSVITYRIVKNIKSNENTVQYNSQAILFSYWAAFFRTVMTQLYSYVIALSIESIIDNSRTNGNLSFSICLIILNIFGLILYGVQFFINFYVLQLPLDYQKLPYCGINSKSLLLKEMIKSLILIQNLFHEILEDNQFGQFGYYVFILLAFLVLSFRTPFYFNRLIDKVNKICLMICLSFIFICCLRILFLFEILELVLFLPIIAIVLYSCLNYVQNRQVLRNILRLTSKKQMTHQQQLEMLLYIIVALQRQSNTDLINLKAFYYNHRITCSRDTCICRAHYGIMINNLKGQMFSYQESNVLNIDEVQIEPTFELQGQQYESGPIYDVETIEVKILDNLHLEEFFDDIFIQDNRNNNQKQQKLDKNKDNLNNNEDERDDNQSDQKKKNELDIMCIENFEEFQSNLPLANYHYETRKYFFTWLYECILKDNETQNSALSSNQSLEFHMNYIYFINYYLKKQYFAIFHLLKTTKKFSKLRFLDQLHYKICEYLLVRDIQTKVANDETIDFTAFIEGNHQQIIIEQLYEDTTQQIIDFWKIWQMEVPNILNIYKLGREISRDVQKIKLQTKALESNSSWRRDISKYQQYMRFHYEILNDPITSNQMQNFIKNYLLSRKTIMINNDHQMKDLNDFNDQGICIVKPIESRHNTYDILFGNKFFCQLTGFNQQNVIGQNINSIMPSILGKIHNEFIKKFYEEGNSNNIGRKRLVFVKNLLGYITPVMVKLSFYYNHKFKYTFILTLQKINKMNFSMQKNLVIPKEECMYFITDNNLKITEYSLDALKLLNLSISNMQSLEQFQSKSFELKHVVPDIEDIMHQSFGLKLIPENDTQGLVGKVIQFRKFNSFNQVFDDHVKTNGLLNYVQQRYYIKNEKIVLNIFMIIPFSKFGGTGTQTLQINGLLDQTRTLHFNTKNADQQQEITNSKVSLNNDSLTFYDKISSMSSSGSTSSDSGIYNAFQAKTLLFKKKPPQTLITSVYVILTILIIYFGVSIYNLGVFLSKHQDIYGRIQVYSYIASRNTFLRMNMMDIKMIQKIASNNTAHFNASKILPNGTDRVQFLYDQIFTSIEQIKYYEQKYDQFIGNNKDNYNFDLKFDDMQFLTEERQIYYETVTYKHAVNLYISYASSFDLVSFFVEKPDMNFTGYPIYNNTDTLSTIKQKDTMSVLYRSIYFIFSNGLFRMQELGQRQSNMLKKASNEQTEMSQLTLNVTTFVSIGIISFILIISFPLLNRVYYREHQVIQFFNLIKDSEIDMQLNKCIEYQQSYQKRKEQELEHLKEPTVNILIDSLKQKSKISQQKIKINTMNSYNKTSSFKKYALDESSIKIKDVFEEKKKKPISIFKREKKLKRVKIDQSKEEDEEAKDEKSKEVSHNFEEEEEVQDDKQLYNQKHSQKKLQQKHKFINKQLQKLGLGQKIRLFLGLLIFIIYFNSSFLVSFYYSSNVFLYDQQSTLAISNYFQREECVYNMLLFTIERSNRLNKIPIKIYSDDIHYETVRALYYFIDHCQEVENNIATIRKSYPDYFQANQIILEELESEKLCELTQEPQYVQFCQKRAQGIAQKGIGTFMQLVISQVTQSLYKFDSVKSPKEWTSAYVFTVIDNERFQQTVDMFLFYLAKSFKFMQQTVIDATLAYFDEAKNTYLLVIGLFMSFTAVISLIFGILVYRKARDRLLEIQNMLIMIPLVEIDQKDRQKIENFLSK